MERFFVWHLADSFILHIFVLTKTETKMQDLFDTPVRQRKVRNNVVAYQYRNGTININGQKYVMYSLTDAIKKYRKDFPI
jgi:hypothetical protein